MLFQHDHDRCDPDLDRPIRIEFIFCRMVDGRLFSDPEMKKHRVINELSRGAD